MKKNNSNSILILGALAIFGIIVLQVYWLVMAWQIKDREFDERINITLRKVAENLALKTNTKLPKTGLIKKLSANEYLVNFNDMIPPDILEDYLVRELDMLKPDLKFEYAVYDCFSDDLVYGNCCGVTEKTKSSLLKKLPGESKYTYYFIVRFPDKRLFLLSNIKLFILLGLFAIIVIIAYVYALTSLYEQRKLSELQKDFVDNMTHEFKTPLTSIKLAAEVLYHNPAIEKDSKLKKYTGIITQQSDKLTSHIERLLDLIRSDKKFNLKFENIELSSFIKNLVSNLEHELNLKNTTVNLALPSKTIYIKADKYHFNNIILNIIDNAIKYNDNEDKIIDISVKEHNGMYLLSIKDNGTGISQENLKHIFKKFYRVQKDNIHNAKGFGLGLYYVKNIIKLHGWDIEVKSQPGEGTEFIIKIKNSKNR